MKKYNEQDQILLAAWAADCASRVLDLFEKNHPLDSRPRKAIEVCRTWIRLGVFEMAVVRNASLDAHAAAREKKENETACFAARAAGQAVATAHVPQHAFGAAYYALKAIAATAPNEAETNLTKELDWQSQHLPENLREEFRKRVIIQKAKNRILVKIKKDKEF